MTKSPRGRARSDPIGASAPVAAALVALALGAAGACAPSHRLGSPPDPVPGAAPRRDPAAPRGGTIVVGLGESVDPAHAPTPTNDSERLVFRNLYETLVRVGIDGAIHPGLASGWKRSRDGREWTFALRDGARFWDGTPLEPADVRLSWMAAERRDRAAGRATPWVWLEGGAEAVTVEGGGGLIVRLAMSMEDTPAFFAHPALAVADRRRGETWPVGTGPFRPTPESRPGETDLVCLPNEQVPRGDGPWARLVFRARPGSDPRDLPAESVDALLVRDRATLDYFVTGSDWTAAPLPPDRLYVLLADDSGSDGATRAWRDVISNLARIEMANSVVLSYAEPASSVLSGATPSDAPCPPAAALAGPSGAAGDSGRSRGGERKECESRVIFRADDNDARRLAERLVFISSGRCIDASGRRTVPLPPGEFERSLASGQDGAFVTRLDRNESPPCARLGALAGAAPWLASLLREVGAGGVGEDPADAGSSASAESLAVRLEERGVALPLVATRAHLVTRAGLAGIQVDGDGAVRFDRAGWTGEAAAR